jgi:CubicO group peptidase (beta-lactamase class C family)
MRRRSIAFFLLWVAAACTQQRSPPAGPPTALPESVGMSSERLARMRRVMQGYVDRGELAGLVLLVARYGRIVELSARGMQNLERKEPMAQGTIVRMASMTKPITSAAVLMLLEEGRLLLTDPLSKYLPAFRQPKVAMRSRKDGPVELVPAQREITIRDLLTHRAGITYSFADRGYVGDEYRKLGVDDGLSPGTSTMAENIARLARAPLVSQPGREFHYGLSVDVLGHVIEVISGKSLEAFLSERIFKPLRMEDTGFVVPQAKWRRFATLYMPRAGGGLRPLADGEKLAGPFASIVAFPNGVFREGRRSFSGGAGLASTALDYFRFAEMLLEGGELEGVRLLSPKTVALMTTSHTRDLPHEPDDDGIDFGLGVGVTMDVGASHKPGSVGSFGWGGILGTKFFVDPKEKLVGVLLAQRFPAGRLNWREQFEVMVYQAIVH